MISEALLGAAVAVILMLIYVVYSSFIKTIADKEIQSYLCHSGGIPRIQTSQRNGVFGSKYYPPNNITCEQTGSGQDVVLHSDVDNIALPPLGAPPEPTPLTLNECRKSCLAAEKCSFYTWDNNAQNCVIYPDDPPPTLIKSTIESGPQYIGIPEKTLAASGTGGCGRVQYDASIVQCTPMKSSNGDDFLSFTAGPGTSVKTPESAAPIATISGGQESDCQSSCYSHPGSFYTYTYPNGSVVESGWPEPAQTPSGDSPLASAVCKIFTGGQPTTITAYNNVKNATTNTTNLGFVDNFDGK